MKIAVIGGSGLIGSKVVQKLRDAEHLVVAASPATGINTITGEGLLDALKDTDIVIDLANAPSFEDNAVMEFFKTSGTNLLAAALNAGVKHHMALSIVGVDDMQNVGYMRAKKAQEELITQSEIPYTIIRSTQFFEFLKGIADQATEGNKVHLSELAFQPIAAENVAGFITQFALNSPVNGKIEIAGPERATIYEMVNRYLQRSGDSRQAVPNGEQVYYGGKIPQNALVPAGAAHLGSIHFDQWFEEQKGNN